MWSAEGGGSVHSKNRLVSSRQHRATEVRKLRFLSSCQHTHGCYAPASWAARHTTVRLDIYIYMHILCIPIVFTNTGTNGASSTCPIMHTYADYKRHEFVHTVVVPA